MAEYRKFYLVPGQQAPEGSTSTGMPDGGIVWIGDTWTATKITSHVMTTEEMTEYELLLKYMDSETVFEISFDDFKDDTKLAAIKTDITTKLTDLSNDVTGVIK